MPQQIHSCSASLCSIFNINTKSPCVVFFHSQLGGGIIKNQEAGAHHIPRMSHSLPICRFCWRARSGMCSRMRWEYPGKQGKPPSSWSQKTSGTYLEKNQTSELKRKLKIKTLFRIPQHSLQHFSEFTFITDATSRFSVILNTDLNITDLQSFLI